LQTEQLPPLEQWRQLLHVVHARQIPVGLHVPASGMLMLQQEAFIGTDWTLVDEQPIERRGRIARRRIDFIRGRHI